MKQDFSYAFSLIFLFSVFSISAFGQEINARNFNERFVIPSIAELIQAEKTFQAASTTGSYGTLAELAAAKLIDRSLGSGLKYGYRFVIKVDPAKDGVASGFVIDATPMMYRKSGVRSFFADESGVVRGEDNGGISAGLTSPEVDVCVLWAPADNEKCVIKDMRVLHSSQLTYQASTGNYVDLQDLYSAGLIPQRLSQANSRGYLFSVIYFQPSGSAPGSFRFLATPRIYNQTGIRSFYIDQTGVLRGADKQGQYANENDPPIEF